MRLRYLAAYVGESVTVRYEPRDLGEIQVFFEDKFLCRAISAELAGATVPLREIVRRANNGKVNCRAFSRVGSGRLIPYSI